MRCAQTFEALHRKRFGYIDEAEPILDTLTVEAIASSPAARCSHAIGRQCDRSTRSMAPP